MVPFGAIMVTIENIQKHLTKECQDDVMLVCGQITRENIHGPCDILNAAVGRYRSFKRLSNLTPHCYYW